MYPATKCIHQKKKSLHYQTYLTTKCIHFFAILMYYLLEFFFEYILLPDMFCGQICYTTDTFYCGYVLSENVLFRDIFWWKRFGFSISSYVFSHHCILSACIKIVYALEKLNIVIPVAWFFPPVIYSGPHPS